MKNVIIVVKDGCSVGYGKDINVSQKSNDGNNIVASLKVLNKIMEEIPKEASETLYIYLPDLLKGIMSGYAIEYVKTGKQMDNKEISADILEQYKLFYKLYGERILNVRFNIASFIPKMRIGKEEMMALRNKAYTELNKATNTLGANTINNQASQILDPDKEIREMFDEQIKKALSSGNMELYVTLKAERDKLQQPSVVNMNSISTNNISFEPSDFDSIASDYEVEDNSTEENISYKKSATDETPDWEETVERL